MQSEAAPFVEGGAACLDNAMAWGEQYGIGVLLDLHAANGSQNGFDHSAPVSSSSSAKCDHTHWLPLCTCNVRGKCSNKHSKGGAHAIVGSKARPIRCAPSGFSD